MSAKRNGLLLHHVQAIEVLEERKRRLAQDVAARMKAARADGFDPAIIRAVVRERRMTAEQREEQQALLDMYRAALGMLADTPLGDAARRRLSGEAAKPDPAEGGAQPAPAVAAPTPEEIIAARAEGAAAAKAGRPVIANPHVAGDPRRAAWDEGWCAATGSDGMEIPPAWRRSNGAGAGKGAPT